MMIHTQHDAVVFTYLMLLFLGTLVAGVYAVAVLIALFLKAFRSRRALYASFVLSAIASIPFLWALILQWPYLPGEWDMNPDAGVVSLLDAVLLCFVWVAPPVQYRFVRRNLG